MKWTDEAWMVFKAHWTAFVLYLLFQVIVHFAIIFLIPIGFVAYIVSLLLSVLLSPGYYIAGSNKLRNSGSFEWVDLFRGAYYFYPLFLQCILVTLLIIIGFACFIVPGLYFIVAFFLCSSLYIEYAHEGLGLWQAMIASLYVVNKHFGGFVLLILWIILLNILGLVCCGVGLFISIPVTALMPVFVVRDIFTLSKKEGRNKCFCCC